MAMSRRIARPLLASIFVVGGIDALRNPAGKATKGEIVVGHLSESVDAIPADPVVAVQVNGAIQIGAGVLLAIGKFRRLAALALIVSIVPTTLAGHRFWEESDQVSRKQQKIHFLKNLGLLGGLILAALDTEGEPSRMRPRNAGSTQWRQRLLLGGLLLAQRRAGQRASPELRLTTQAKTDWSKLAKECRFRCSQDC